MKDLVHLSKEYSILNTVLDKMHNKAQDSIHSLNENILNSSLFGSDKSEILSRIDEEKDSSDLQRSKYNDTSPINNNRFPMLMSKFFNASQISNSRVIDAASSESLDLTLILDYNNIEPIQSQLPPLTFLKSLKEDDFSVIITENNTISDDELEISVNFLIGQLDDNKSQEEESFRLEDLLGEENKNIIHLEDHEIENKDNAILEISSYIVKSEESSQADFVVEKISIKRKLVNILMRVFSRSFLKKEVKTFILFYISVFNAFYVPLSLIFNSFNYPPIITALECINVVYLSYLFIKKTTKYARAMKRLGRNHHHIVNSASYKLTKDDENAIILQMKKKSEIYFTIFYEFLYVIPFPMILSYVEPTNSAFFCLCIFRLINLKYLIRGLDYLKEKNSLLAAILQILLLSIVFIHLFACILIAIAFSQSNFNHSFLRRMPAPEESFSHIDRESLEISDTSIYIHCLYWVYATVSKSGVAEMQVVSLQERVFSIVVMTIGGLFYIFVFGNMVSLVEDLTPKMKSILEKQEKKVLKFVRYMKMKGLERKVESYFNHIWKSDKGFNEFELLENLPTAIKVDIEKCEYLPIFKKSKFFTHGKLIPRPDSSLIYSLFKLLQCEIFIPEDLIIIAGEYCSKVYFILEGRVELVSFDLKNQIILQSGDFFGGILGYERQVIYYKIIPFFYFLNEYINVY